jgi:hypothetical protein
LNQDFREILSELSAHQAEFLVVGAYALAGHGLPRATGDIDIWIRPTAENAERVWRALAAFGAPLDTLTIKDLTTPGVFFQMGVQPRRIDILTAIDGVEFEEAWLARHICNIDGLKLSVLGRSELIQNKRATGRPKDLADLAWLEGADN